MGGWGSTRWGWHTKKTTVEECRQLDAARWQREGILAPDRMTAGGWQWSNARTGESEGSIGYLANTDQSLGIVRLRYTVTPPRGDPRDIDYTLPAVTTRPHFGGLQWWFQCPGRGCGRRVRKVYLPPRGDYFLCRHCHDLAYTSSQTHDKTRDRWRPLDDATLLELMRGNGRQSLSAAQEILERRLGSSAR